MASIFDIFIFASEVAGQTKPNIAVSPEVANLTALTGAVTLRFHVASADYVFQSADQGPAIEFLTEGSEVSFTPVIVAPDRINAHCSTMNNNGVAYSYRAYVVSTKTGLLSSIDPIIQNQNQ